MLFERTIGTLDRGASETRGGRVGWGVDGGWAAGTGGSSQYHPPRGDPLYHTLY